MSDATTQELNDEFHAIYETMTDPDKQEEQILKDQHRKAIDRRRTRIGL
jgi:hypothetical protein